MKALRFALLLLLALFPQYCYAWTDKDWIGIAEAVCGASALGSVPSVPSDACDNCGGSGRLGDGVVSVECPVCKGTGKPVNQSIEHAGCETCGNAGTIKPEHQPQDAPRTDAPAEKHEALNSGGGTYRQRLFRRR